MQLEDIKKLVEGKDTLPVTFKLISLSEENEYLRKKIEDKEKEIERLTGLLKE